MHNEGSLLATSWVPRLGLCRGESNTIAYFWCPKDPNIMSITQHVVILIVRSMYIKDSLNDVDNNLCIIRR